MSRHPQPSGTVTFLFTDIEGSTRLWEHQPADAREALARHDALAADRIAVHAGVLVKSRGAGDSLFAVFARATDAVQAALALQLALWSETPLLRARMALHTGEAQERDGDYYGPAVNRCARLRAIAHGGQILLSLPAEELARDTLPAGASLRDLGEQRLRDLARPERVFQLCHPDLPSDFPALKSLDALPNNLPRQLTSFVGREPEIAQVRELLDATRLLTLTGAGGSGKTRLVLQAAADVLDQYPDGVWFVDLAPITDPALVPQTVASALTVREEAGKPLAQSVTEYARPKQFLLVLDNCEHLLDACARFADALLRACPHVKLLATSREALAVPGETSWRVPKLSLPQAGALPSLEALTQFEAVRLFLDRAGSVLPGFAVTNANAPAVAQVCHRLDGIPLALELAAARVKVLSVEQIALRLDDRFRLLTGGSRTVLPRQQTLHAALDWSYELLTDQEKALLARLSVFAGGWRLEAAESVCAGDPIEEWEVLDLLARLVDKSLVSAEMQGEQERYNLLETVRQYGQERLLESGGQGAVRRRHRDWFVTYAEQQIAFLLSGSHEASAIERLEEEYANLRSAFDEALRGTDDSDALARLAGSLYWFWTGHHASEGRQMLAAAVAYAKATGHVTGQLLLRAARLADEVGDSSTARALNAEALRNARAAGEWPALVEALGWVGFCELRQGQFSMASAYYLEALQLAQENEDRPTIPWLLLSLGHVSRFERRYAEARQRYSEAQAHFQEYGLASSVGAEHVLLNLAHVERLTGDLVLAHSYYVGGLRSIYERGDMTMIPLCLEGLACLAASWGQPDRAARLFGAAEALREALDIRMSPVDRAECEAPQQAARAALAEDDFASAWAAGRAMTLEQALADAVEEAPP